VIDAGRRAGSCSTTTIAPSVRCRHRCVNSPDRVLFAHAHLVARASAAALYSLATIASGLTFRTQCLTRRAAPARSHRATDCSHVSFHRLRTCEVRFVMTVECPRGDLSRCSNVRSCGYSITSSARTSRAVGTVIPKALAALRLTNSSTFVVCSTGKSAGFSPLRIRPVYTPT
jgi:hypothetical protein